MSVLVALSGPHQDFPHPLKQTGVPTLPSAPGGMPPPVAMKQPSPPRVITVPWIRVQGLEVLLLVTKTIMESTTYVVGTGSPSMRKRGWGDDWCPPPPPGLTGMMGYGHWQAWQDSRGDEGLHSKQPCPLP